MKKLLIDYRDPDEGSRTLRWRWVTPPSSCGTPPIPARRSRSALGFDEADLCLVEHRRGHDHRQFGPACGTSPTDLTEANIGIRNTTGTIQVCGSSPGRTATSTTPRTGFTLTSTIGGKLGGCCRSGAARSSPIRPTRSTVRGFSVTGLDIGDFRNSGLNFCRTGAVLVQRVRPRQPDWPLWSG